jgi:pimeloyl-ACP methyl ester carboxylesterase
MVTLLPSQLSAEVWRYFPLLRQINFTAVKWAILSSFVIWGFLELIFAIIIIGYVAPRLQKFRKPVPTEIPPVEFYKRIFDVMDSLKAYSIERYMSGFFHGAALEDIYQDNLNSFIAWGVFGKYLFELSDENRNTLREILAFAKERYPALRNLKPGFNEQVKHCAISFEPVPYLHRPLLLYVLNGVSEMIYNAIVLRMHGFQFLEAEGLNYWIREGSNATDPSLPPLLVLHGISPGWSMYYLLIKAFAEDRTVILADLDAIKLKSMFFFMPSMQQFTASLLIILRRHRIDKVSIIGHSFGSITAAWLLNKHADRVAHVTLLDPVSLLLFLPDCVQKFVYANPKTMVEWILFYFASREITISYALHRNFIWHTNILWLEDIPKHIGVVVGLAMNDEITNPQVQDIYIRNQIDTRRQYAKDTIGANVAPIEVVHWENFSHGQIMLSPSHLTAFHKIVSANERKTLNCSFAGPIEHPAVASYFSPLNNSLSPSKQTLF